MIAIFPSGAFTGTVSLTYQRLAAVENSGALLGIGQPFEFSAISTDGGQPAGLAPGKTFAPVLRYSDVELGPAIERSLRLVYREGNLWLPEPSSQVHDQANAMTALPVRLGWWTILGENHRTYLPWVSGSEVLPLPPCRGQDTVERWLGWHCRVDSPATLPSLRR